MHYQLNIFNLNLLKKKLCSSRSFCFRCPGFIYSETKSLYGCSKSVFQICQANLLNNNMEKGIK